MTRGARFGRALSRLAALAAVALPCACALGPPPAPEATGRPTAYVAGGQGLIARFAPVLVTERPDLPYNRIGAPVARFDGEGGVTVAIDPDRPEIFHQAVSFHTPRGEYTNLIYRVHFTRVPYRMRLAHVSAGPNVGLLVIVTLDGANRPVLVTTVHTCGCYLAFLPTALLPEDAYPEGWDPGGQTRWGAHLPGRLALPSGLGDVRPVLTLAEGTHRVKDAALMLHDDAAQAYRLVPAALRPMADLDRLPLPDGTSTSFFETRGRRKGYVRGARKPFERLLVSWWALDWDVGVDKRYGPREAMNTVFYTSLKPWAREESDMWPFADFLKYWGWRL